MLLELLNACLLAYSNQIKCLNVFFPLIKILAALPCYTAYDKT